MNRETAVTFIVNVPPDKSMPPISNVLVYVRIKILDLREKGENPEALFTAVPW